MFSTALRQRHEKRNATGMRPWLEGLEGRTVLSTFKVNTLLDTVAVNLQTGKDASGHVSLRSAIMAADARPNADTIIIPGGTYQLTIAGANEDNSATGDLDIKGNLTITGRSSSSTIIDGNSLDRVFQVSERQGVDFQVDDTARPRHRLRWRALELSRQRDALVDRGSGQHRCRGRRSQRKRGLRYQSECRCRDTDRQQRRERSGRIRRRGRRNLRTPGR